MNPLESVLATRPDVTGVHAGVFEWPGPGSISIEIGGNTVMFYPTRTISILEPYFNEALAAGLTFKNWCTP